MHVPPAVHTDAAVARYHSGNLEIRLRKMNGRRRRIPVEYEGMLIHLGAEAC